MHHLRSRNSKKCVRRRRPLWRQFFPTVQNLSPAPLQLASPFGRHCRFFAEFWCAELFIVDGKVCPPNGRKTG